MDNALTLLKNFIKAANIETYSVTEFVDSWYGPVVLIAFRTLDGFETYFLFSAEGELKDMWVE